VEGWQYQIVSMIGRSSVAFARRASGSGHTDGCFSVTQTCERQESKSMSFFHASEQLYAGAEQLRRFLMSDFPDERLPDHRSRLEYRAAPYHDVVEFIRLDVAAHGAPRPLVLRP
jgi:hypothetical protein